MIQIRDVPQELSQKLKLRAAMNGQSLSEYLKQELIKMAAKPTLAEFSERIKYREPVEIDISAEMLVAEERQDRYGD